MPEQKYLPGTIWGKKQIVAFAGHNKYKQPTYTWRCVDCGREYPPRTGTDIARSPYARCCQYKNKRRADHQGFGWIDGLRYAKYKASAKQRGHAFEVSARYLSDLWVAQGPICPYSGVDLSFIDGTASLDRIDSTAGYIEGNLHWVHLQVNKMKSNMTEEEFFKWCKLIVGQSATR